MATATAEIYLKHTDLATLDFALSFFDDEDGTIPTDLTGVTVESELYDKVRQNLIGTFTVTALDPTPVEGGPSVDNSRYFKLSFPPENVSLLQNVLVFDVRLNSLDRVDIPLRVFVEVEKGYTGWA